MAALARLTEPALIAWLTTAADCNACLCEQVGHGEASASCTGLLHPLNPNARLAWKGAEGYAEALSLMRLAGDNQQGVMSSGGILRPALSERKRKDFIKAGARILRRWAVAQLRTLRLRAAFAHYFAPQRAASPTGSAGWSPTSAAPSRPG